MHLSMFSFVDALPVVQGLLLLLPVAFGALTLEDPLFVKQRALVETRKIGAQGVLRALFEHMVGKLAVELQFVPFDQTGNADSVIADVACKLYAIYAKKPSGSSTDAWLKGSDHATVAAANGDIVVKLSAAAEHALVFPDGLALATGLTIASHTAVDGSTDSDDADAPGGFCIIGAA